MQLFHMYLKAHESSQGLAHALRQLSGQDLWVVCIPFNEIQKR